jgi:isoaspartyl peptidase/L-asparaginase-like protein (Ntn-hydrolase superfamily)
MGAVVLTNGEGGVGIRTAVDTLVNKGTALDAVEAGIRVVELDPKVKIRWIWRSSECSW